MTVSKVTLLDKIRGMMGTPLPLLNKTEAAMNGQRGGRRPGAGRKPKSTKIDEETEAKREEMIRQRVGFLYEMHDPEILKAFKAALVDTLKSGKVVDKSWALRVLAEIILKTPIPESIKEINKEDGTVTVEALLDAWRDKAEKGVLDGSEEDLDSEGEDPVRQPDTGEKGADQ